jgi:hypothetical protein
MKQLTTILAACTFISGSASAALLITEQFNNGVAGGTELIGLAGSSGNNWARSTGTAANTTLTFSTTSLSYGGLSTLGGAGIVGANSGLPQQAFTLDNTGERFFSFIFQHNNASNVSGGRILFEAYGSSSEGYGINYDYNSGTGNAAIFARAGGSNVGSFTVGAANPILVVGRYTPDGGTGGTTTIWVNPTNFTDLSTIASSAAGTAATTNASVTRDDGILFRSTTSPAGAWLTVDDMRLAESYADLGLVAVPEPTSPAMLIGGIGMLMLIRRRNS